MAPPMTTKWRALAFLIREKMPKRKIDRIWISLLMLLGLVMLHQISLALHLVDPAISDQRIKHLNQFKNSSVRENIGRSPKNEPSVTNMDGEYSDIVSSSLRSGSGVSSHSDNSFVVDPFYNISTDGNNLWDADTKIPSWMKAYFNWHKHKRQNWDTQKWKSERWMVMQCLVDQDPICGGTADRLKPLPFLMRAAYDTKRILLIRWTRPTELEEFLVPPKGGVDWRVPEWMANIMTNSSNGHTFISGNMIIKRAKGKMSLVRTRFQSFTYGSDIYDANREKGEPSFYDIYSNVWRLFFRPSQGVDNRIEEQLEKMELVPGAYASAHLRALYRIDERPKIMTRKWTTNALNCASELRPGVPIFFASDSSDASGYARVYGKKKGARIVTHTPNPNPPLHLEMAEDWQNRSSADFYDTFVDLYLIALGGCVTFNIGGFGHWGYVIGGTKDCAINQKAKNIKGTLLRTCAWHDGVEAKVTGLSRTTPLFLEAAE